MRQIDKSTIALNGNLSPSAAVESDADGDTPSPPKAQHRIVELDALRGLAAMVVVLFHYTIQFNKEFGRIEPLAFSLPGGERGVDLFFMISGFVILMTLDRTKSVSEFVIGRISRLYPAFWAAVILTYLVASWAQLPGHIVSLRDALLNLTMVPMLLKVELVDGVYWTLQAELLFYIVMLLIHQAGGFRNVTRTLSVWLSLAAATHMALAFGANSPIVLSVVPKLQTLASLKYLHLFAIGIVFYDLRRTGWTMSHAAILALCVAISAGSSSGLQAGLVVLMASLLFAAVSGRVSFLATWPLVNLGVISYTLYLVHENIGFVMLRWLQQIGCEAHVAVLLTIAGAIALATVISVLVEQPALRAIRAATKPKTSRGNEGSVLGELRSESVPAPRHVADRP